MSYCIFCEKILTVSEEQKYGDMCDEHGIQFTTGHLVTPTPQGLSDDYPDNIAEFYDDFRDENYEPLDFNRD